jgi:hypothetical protein
VPAASNVKIEFVAADEPTVLKENRLVPGSFDATVMNKKRSWHSLRKSRRGQKAEVLLSST